MPNVHFAVVNDLATTTTKNKPIHRTKAYVKFYAAIQLSLNYDSRQTPVGYMTLELQKSTEVWRGYGESKCESTAQ